MAVVGIGSPGSVERPNIGSRFVKDVREVVGGIIPGMAMLGGAAIGDIGRSAQFLAGEKPDFRLPDVGAGIAKGFWEQSFIPALATGHPIEAYKRISERPFSAALDLSGLTFGGTGAAARGLKYGASKGVVDPFSPSFRTLTGYRPINAIPELGPSGRNRVLGLDSDSGYTVLGSALTKSRPFEAGDTKYKLKSFGDEYFARPIGRRIRPTNVREETDVVELPDVWSNRSHNEFAAKIGDQFHAASMKINPEKHKFVGAYGKLYRGMMKNLYSIRSRNMDHMESLYNGAVAQYYDDVDKEFPDMNPKRRKVAADYAQNLDAQHLTTDKWVNTRKLYSTDGLGVGTAIARNKKRITRLGDEITELYRRSDALNARKNAINNKEVSATVDEYKAVMDEIASSQKKAEELSYMADRLARNNESMAKWQSVHLSEDKELPLDKQMREILEHKAEIDAIQKSMANAKWQRYLRDNISGPLEAAYVANSGGMVKTSDLEQFKYRATYAFTGDMDISKAVQRKMDPDNPNLEEEVIFTPALPAYSDDFVPLKDFIGKKTDRQNVLMPREKVPSDPDDLLLGGANRIDPYIWRDSYMNEMDIKTDRDFQGEAFKYFKQIDQETANRYVKQKMAAYPEGRTGKVDSTVPLVIASTSSGPMMSMQKIQQSLNDLTLSASRSGYEELARSSQAVREFTAPGTPGERLLKQTLPTNMFQRARDAKDLSKSEKFYVVPRHIWDAFVADAARSENFMMNALKNPTEVWKHMVLHARPKWIVNNAAGSIMLLAMSEGWGNAAKQLFTNSKWRERAGRSMFGAENWKKVQEAKGNRIDFKIDLPDGTQTTKNMTIAEYVQSRMPEVTYSHGSTWQYKSDFMRGSSNKFKRAYLKLVDKIADINARVADDPSRIAKATAIYERRYKDFVKDIEISREQLKANIRAQLDDMTGLNEWRRDILQQQLNDLDEPISDADAMNALLSDEKIRNEVIDEVLSDLIDFQDMTPFEREYVRAFIPFWTWIKGSTKIGAQGFYEHAARYNAYAALSGQAGREMEEEYGSLPSFLMSTIPLPDIGPLQNEEGTRVVNVGGMSPWGTPGDIASLGASMVPVIGSRYPPYGPESPISMLGPIPKSIIESLTGRDVYYGTPLPRGGTLGGTFLKRAISVPQLSMFEKHYEYGFPPQKKIPTGSATAGRNLLFDVMGYMGSPTPLDLRLGPAHRRAEEEQREAIPRQ